MNTTWPLGFVVPQCRQLTQEQRKGVLNRFLLQEPRYWWMSGLWFGLGVGVPFAIVSLLGLRWNWLVLLMTIGFVWAFGLLGAAYELRRKREEIAAYVKERYRARVGEPAPQ